MARNLKRKMSLDAAKELLTLYYNVSLGPWQQYEERRDAWHAAAMRYGNNPEFVRKAAAAMVTEAQKQPHLAKRGTFSLTVNRRIKPGVRFDVLNRDGFRCVYCGASAKEDMLVVDHVVPVIIGGTADMSNLVTACYQCNVGKGDSEPDKHPLEVAQ